MVALAAIYLVGANLILNTQLLDGVMNAKREKLQVRWQSGYTLLPGFVHVEGLQIRGQSRSLQWECRLTEGDFRIRLLPLILKEVRVLRGRGAGFAFSARPRLDAPKGAPRSDFFPVIDGLENPPDPTPESLYPPRTTPRKNPWDIEVRNVVLDGAVDLWLGRMRLAGTGEVGGDFFYEISRDMEVPSMHLEIDPAVFSWEGRPLVEAADFDLDGSLGRFRLKETRGPELLGQLKGSVRLAGGELRDLEAFDAFVPGGEGLGIERGHGRLDLDLAADPVEGSEGSVSLAIDDLVASMASGPMSGDLSFESRLVEGNLAEGTFRVDGGLRLDRFLWPQVAARLEKKGREVTDEDLWSADLKLRGGLFDLGRPSSIETPLSFTMTDTHPLLAAFSISSDDEDAALPGWIKHIPNVPDLVGEGRIHLSQSATSFEGVRIDGGGLRLRTEIRTRPEGRVGALYVKFKGIGAGIGTENGKRSIHLIRPQRWYLGRLEELGIESQPFDPELAPEVDAELEESLDRDFGP